MQEVVSIVQASSGEAVQILKAIIDSRIEPMFSQPRGQLAQKSVPQLTQGLFASIREGFIGDTVRKFNYKLLLQMQDGLSEYLQKCLDQEDITALCSTEEVHSCPQSKTCRSFASQLCTLAGPGSGRMIAGALSHPCDTDAVNG